MKKIYLYLLLIFILIPNSIKAEEKFYTDFDEEINIEEEMDGSIILGGNNVTLNNITNGIGVLLGNKINYAANSEYAFIIGNEININGNFKDGLILGNEIIFNNETIIDRDIAIIGNNVTLTGTFNRDVIIYASTVTLKEVTIKGDIKIECEELNINKTTSINGTLTTYQDLITDIDGNANINKISTLVHDDRDEEDPWENIYNKLVYLIRLFVIFALTLYLIPKLYEKLENKKDILNTNLKGLIGLITIPIISLILLFTSFGLSLGLILLGLYLLLLYTSIIFTGYKLGNYLWLKYISKAKSNYLYGLIGITIVYLLTLIPYIGWLIKLFILTFGIGYIISLFNKNNLKK